MKNSYGFLPALVCFLLSGIISNSSIAQTVDRGDALASYGAALHTNPAVGPFLGATRGDTEPSSGTTSDMIADYDDGNGTNDEDAFSNNFTVLAPASNAVFLPNIDATLAMYSITFAVGGGVNSPVRGWIDFDCNGVFDATEKASATSASGSVTLTWILPANLQPFFTYARLRTTSTANVLQIENPTGTAADGEVEDYVVRVIRVYPPRTSSRDSLNFLSQNGVSGVANTITAVNGLTVSGVSVTMSLSGTTPNSLGINNLHEPSLVGVRTGHNTGVGTSEATALIARYKFNSLLNEVNFKLLDIDVGDHIKIGVFNNGVPVPFYFNTLNGNYYVSYDSANKVIYCQNFIDSGVDPITPNSIDQGIEVFCSSLMDSLSFTYWDLTGSGTYTLASFTADQTFLLPVKLTDFSVEKRYNNIVTLNWKAENESELSLYNIESSADGIYFNAIASVPADMSGSYEYEVSLPDNLPVIYYRLKMVDRNGSYQFSKVINYKPANDRKLIVRNIFMENGITIDVNAHKTLDASVYLYSVQGQLIRNYKVRFLNGNNNIRLPVPVLNRGIYLVQIKAEGEVYNRKISGK